MSVAEAHEYVRDHHSIAECKDGPPFSEECKDIWNDRFCTPICPKLPHGERQCSGGHGHHEEPHLARESAMIWGILFLASAVLVGAGAHLLLARWLPALPYTVGLLIFGIFIGALASWLRNRPQCPQMALDAAYDRLPHDGLISEEEWDLFRCKDCHKDSECYDKRRTFPAHGRLDQEGGYFFDELDKPYKYHDFEAPHQWHYDLYNDTKLAPDELWRPECNLLSSWISLATGMDPHVMLIVFLPALLFESAFALDIATFQRQMVQILILAFPGVVFCSLMTGAIIQGLYSHWSYEACALLGTILSATDPVAVVALLKEVGAAKTLGTLIEGESLLNDGSAIVVFQVFYTALQQEGSWVGGAGSADSVEPYQHKPYQHMQEWGMPVEAVRTVVQMALFGVFLGAATGWLTVRCLKLIYNVLLVEVAVVIGVTYLLFCLRSGARTLDWQGGDA